MAAKASLDDVISWLAEDETRSKADAAKVHGWNYGTLRKAIQRHEEREARPVAPVAQETRIRSAKDLPKDVRGLLKTAMTRRLELLALGDLGKPKDEAVIFAILVDKYPDALRIEADDPNTNDDSSETDRIASYLDDPE